MSKGGAPQQEETQAEKTAAQNASQRWSERINDGYLDLEKRQIADSTRDMTGVIHGRSNADVAHAEKVAYATALPDESSMNQVGNTVGKALASSAVDSSRAGQKNTDAKRLNTVRIGNNMAATTSSTLGDLATQANRNATEKLQNQILVNNSKVQAVMQAVGGAVQGYSMKNAGYNFSFKDGLTRDKSKIPGYNAETDPESFQDKQKFSAMQLVGSKLGVL